MSPIWYSRPVTQAALPVEPGHSLINASDHDENGLSRIYPIGEQESRVNHPEQSGYFSGACGITFYGGGAFPEGFNNSLFVADVVLNLVHIDILSPDKAAFKASRHQEKVEFLASTDRSFRPVNLSTGPDGSLYLIDMYRQVIEHPEWIPDEIEATLDLKAGKDKGRIYRITPRGKSMPAPHIFDDLRAIDKIVEALASPNQWVRTTAQRLLVSLQGEAIVPALEALFQQTDQPLARLHAMWTLEERGKVFEREPECCTVGSIPGSQRKCDQDRRGPPGERPGMGESAHQPYQRSGCPGAHAGRAFAESSLRKRTSHYMRKPSPMRLVKCWSGRKWIPGSRRQLLPPPVKNRSAFVKKY